MHTLIATKIIDELISRAKENRSAWEDTGLDKHLTMYKAYNEAASKLLEANKQLLNGKNQAPCGCSVYGAEDCRINKSLVKQLMQQAKLAVQQSKPRWYQLLRAR